MPVLFRRSYSFGPVLCFDCVLQHRRGRREAVLVSLRTKMRWFRRIWHWRAPTHTYLMVQDTAQVMTRRQCPPLGRCTALPSLHFIESCAPVTSRSQFVGRRALSAGMSVHDLYDLARCELLTGTVKCSVGLHVERMVTDHPSAGVARHVSGAGYHAARWT